MSRYAMTVAMCAVLLLSGCGGTAGGQGGAKTPSPLPPSAAQPGKSLGKPRDLVTGLAVPWAIAFMPDGNALVTERDTARLLRVTPRGEMTPVGKVPGVDPGSEGGLLGVAVSPSFERDRHVFLYFTGRRDNRIVRFRYEPGRIGRLETIVDGIPKAGVHNGGRLAFGPDKMLYASTGESGEPPLAQVKKSLGGKILRMRPDGSPAPGNPFGTLVWSYGHRNVQGLAWDGDKRMYASEFGQDTFDEVNRIRKGDNYGWPRIEGDGGGKGAFVDPELTWATSEASPSGLAYAGGSLWVAALRGERLWQVPLSRDGDTGKPLAHFTEQYGRLRGIVRAPDGSLWVTTSNQDGRGDPAETDDRIVVLPLS